MKVELTREEANNVVVSLVSMAKSSQVDVNGMKTLLILSDKFRYQAEKITPKKLRKETGDKV